MARIHRGPGHPSDVVSGGARGKAPRGTEHRRPRNVSDSLVYIAVRERRNGARFGRPKNTMGMLQYKPIQSAKYCKLIGQSRATELDDILKCPQ